MMWILKKFSWAAMSLGLLLFAGPVSGLETAARPGSSAEQQPAPVQPQSPTTQTAQPAKPADEPSVNDAPAAPPPLPDAPASKPAPIEDLQPSAQPVQQSGTQSPTGTAAAEAAKTSGVAASRPSGMAIAPAKQHRRRSFWVKLGAIAGAGVAGGTVFALSRSSSSRPPGTR